MSHIGRDRTRRPRVVHSERGEDEATKFAREMGKIEYLHKPRQKGILRESFETVLMDSVRQALEGNKQAERILIGHRREIERLNRESIRETADINRDVIATDKLLTSENDGLVLLKKRKERLETSTPPQPTEIVEGQIVESSRRLFQLDEHRNALMQKKARLDEDTARERAEAADELQRRLKEVK